MITVKETEVIHRGMRAHTYVWGCRGWQATRTSVSVSPEMVGFPPHQVAWSQPINRCLARKREPIRERLKSPRTPKFEKCPRRFGPIRLLCKHVTNPLKPATNCLCTPYKLGNSLGSVRSDPVHCVHCRALTRVSNKLPFFCELHCLGSLLSSRSGIQTSGRTNALAHSHTMHRGMHAHTHAELIL